MIALPAPIVTECVDPASPRALQSQVIWDVRGSPGSVGTLLQSADAEQWAELLSDDTQRGQRHVVLKVRRTARYRDIGGFIYRAQSSAVHIASRFDPPVCEKKN